MPITVLELVIKAAVDPNKENVNTGIDETDKANIIHECIDSVVQILEDRSSR